MTVTDAGVSVRQQVCADSEGRGVVPFAPFCD
jgi:hypothetical protein